MTAQITQLYLVIYISINQELEPNIARLVIMLGKLCLNSSPANLKIQLSYLRK